MSRFSSVHVPGRARLGVLDETRFFWGRRVAKEARREDLPDEVLGGESWDGVGVNVADDSRVAVGEVEIEGRELAVEVRGGGVGVKCTVKPTWDAMACSCAAT